MNFLKFPIIGDADRSISTAYGMIDPGTSDDQDLPLTIRAVFPAKKAHGSTLEYTEAGANNEDEEEVPAVSTRPSATLTEAEARARDERIARRAKLPPIDCGPALAALREAVEKDDSTSAADALDDIRRLVDVCGSPEYRGLNKGAELCSSLLANDGLQTIDDVNKHFKQTNAGVSQKADKLMKTLIPMIWS